MPQLSKGSIRIRDRIQRLIPAHSLKLILFFCSHPLSGKLEAI
jgi:hypothetical protein